MTSKAPDEGLSTEPKGSSIGRSFEDFLNDELNRELSEEQPANLPQESPTDASSSTLESSDSSKPSKEKPNYGKIVKEFIDGVDDPALKARMADFAEMVRRDAQRGATERSKELDRIQRDLDQKQQEIRDAVEIHKAIVEDPKGMVEIMASRLGFQLMPRDNSMDGLLDEVSTEKPRTPSSESLDTELTWERLWGLDDEDSQPSQGGDVGYNQDYRADLTGQSSLEEEVRKLKQFVGMIVQKGVQQVQDQKEQELLNSVHTGLKEEIAQAGAAFSVELTPSQVQEITEEALRLRAMGVDDAVSKAFRDYVYPIIMNRSVVGVKTSATGQIQERAVVGEKGRPKTFEQLYLESIR